MCFVTFFIHYRCTAEIKYLIIGPGIGLKTAVLIGTGEFNIGKDLSCKIGKILFGKTADHIDTVDLLHLIDRKTLTGPAVMSSLFKSGKELNIRNLVDLFLCMEKHLVLAFCHKRLYGITAHGICIYKVRITHIVLVHCRNIHTVLLGCFIHFHHSVSKISCFGEYIDGTLLLV